MYIGYNVSGGGEGFTGYLQSRDFNFMLLHTYDGYSYSGGRGTIKFTRDKSTFDMQVLDKDTLKVVATDAGYDKVDAEYTFKRAELTKEQLSDFEGTWIDGGELFSDFGTYGNVLNFVLPCGRFVE
jgi:hypothetical protein